MQNNLHNKTQYEEISLIPIRYVMMAASLAIFFGINLGIILTNQKYFIDYFILSATDIETVLGTYLLGALLGVFLGGWIVYSSGRRICLIASSCFGLFAIFASVTATNFALFLLAQFAIGFASAIYLLAVGLYVSEITLPSNRGFCNILIWVLFFGAIELAAILRDIFVIFDTLIYYAIFAFFNIIFILINFVCLPESPRWLASVGYSDASLSTLFKLRHNMGIAARELSFINETSSDDEAGLSLFLQNANYRRSLWLLVALTILFHLSGFIFIPHVLLSLVEKGYLIYQNYSYDFDYNLDKLMATISFIAVCCVAFTVDKFGRDKVLLFGASICLLILSILFIISIFSDIYISSTVLIILSLLYIFGSVIILVVLVPLLACELIPARGREFGVSFVFIANVVLLLFGYRHYMLLMEMINFSGYFLLSIVACILFLLIAYKLVPNTANSSLEGIESRLFFGSALKELGKLN